MQTDQFLKQLADTIKHTVAGSDVLQRERKPAGLPRIAHMQDLGRC